MVQVVCFILGSPVGLGTIICVFGTGTITNIVFGFLKFEPRALKHESIIDTIAACEKEILVSDELSASFVK